jgi:hypothetical protein
MAVDVPVVDPRTMAVATTIMEMAAVGRGAGTLVTTIRGTRGESTTTTIATTTIGIIRMETVETSSAMTISPVNSQTMPVIRGRTAIATTGIRITNMNKQ